MAEPHHTVYLGLGANLGDRQATLRAARDRLPPAVEVVRCSSLYQTPPWGVLDQPPFLNAVCEGRTALAPDELLNYLKTIERVLGRVPTERWGPRVLDLDILFFDELIVTTSHLTIPHPFLHERAFVLLPLRELNPHLVHPGLGKSIAALAQELAPADIHVVEKNW